MTSRLSLLKELRDRVAGATGPNFALDHAIGQWLHGPNVVHETPSGQWVINRHGTHLTPQWERYIAPAYTASLDAAVTLVPEGERWRLDVDAGDGIFATIWNGDAFVTETGSTPALALCLARLEFEISQSEATGKAEG